MIYAIIAALGFSEGWDATGCDYGWVPLAVLAMFALFILFAPLVYLLNSLMK